MNKLSKKKKLNIFNLLIIILVILYAAFGTDLFKDLKSNLASVSNLTGSEETVDVQANGILEVYFIDVGQADSILIKVGSENMLIDAGNNKDGSLLVNYFNELGIDGFSYVIATHPHEDHIGGMDDIINNFKIDKFYMPNKISTTKTFEDMLDSLENNGLNYIVPKKGDSFLLGNALFEVVYAGDETNDINDSSIVLKLTYGNNKFLFTGDATSNVEKIILNQDLESDVLKVAHHGSSYSSTDKFLNAVEPKYAVISVGKDNTYKHPSNETLKKLNARNIKTYRTDLMGTLIFTSDGRNIKVANTKTNTNG